MEANSQKYLGQDIIPAIKAKVELKQDKLIGSGEGQNIKTINGQTILGAGDIEIVDTLYSSTGTNTDGAMTQKATTDAINAVVTAADGKYATQTDLESATDDIADLKTKVTTNTTNITTNTTNITNLTNSLTELTSDVEALEGFAETTVQLDTTLGTENTDSTVTLIKSRAAINNAEAVTNTNIALPVASETQAGVINATTYQAIQSTAEKVESLLGASVAVADLPAAPSNDQLTAAWKTASGKDTIVNGAKIFDSTNNKTWTYYSNTNAWSAIDNENPTIELTNFTNEAAGQIKGDNTTDGKVQAEADGTGSVKGWDTVKTDIATNTSAISAINTTLDGLDDKFATKTEVATLESTVNTNTSDIAGLKTSKQDTLVSGTNIKTINGTSLLGSGDVEIDIPQAMTAAEFEAAWNAA